MKVLPRKGIFTPPAAPCRIDKDSMKNFCADPDLISMLTLGDPENT